MNFFRDSLLGLLGDLGVGDPVLSMEMLRAEEEDAKAVSNQEQEINLSIV